jgi:electron-transferring-flavoprotein dehydrogenase
MRLAARAVRNRLTASATTVRQATLARTLAGGKTTFRQFSTSSKLSAGPIKTTHPAVVDRAQDERWEEVEFERYADQADVAIVGGGPAGLTAAIKLKKLANEAGEDVRVCVFEKASEFGRHTLSGACVEPRALLEIWTMEELEELECPAIKQPVTDDKFMILSETGAIPVPLEPFPWLPMNNHGNYIVRLGHFVAWLAEQAEAEGVELWPGQAVVETLYHEDGSIKGVATNDVGIGKDGAPKDSFERGMEMHAKITLFAEGCRGSESMKQIDNYDLAKDKCPMTYGIGMKELWRIPQEKHVPGKIIHTAGWPLQKDEYGGSFLYHIEDDGEPLVALGFVIGLDYSNPYLNTFRTFQQWKTHPKISEILEGGECLQYGARALNEGGHQAVPEMVMPGGLVLGCSAGLLNVPKIKGTHLAMKSGIVAAETIFAAFQDEERMKEFWTNPEVEEVEEAEVSEDAEEEEEEEELAYPELHKGVHLPEFQTQMDDSWAMKELHGIRNIKPSFHNPIGLLGTMIYTGAVLNPLSKALGIEKWTMKWTKGDHEHLVPASNGTKMSYPAPDGKITFDILTQVSLAGSNHEGDQPAHLALKNDKIPTEHNYAVYDGPEGRYCPAGVYEYVEDDETGKYELNINAQNCVHCKTCSIKDPKQNILWACPEGSGGPAYDGM